MIFKNTVRGFRLANELSQEELADRAGLSRSTIVNIENGKANPSLSTLRCLAAVFGVDISNFLFDHRE